MEPIWPAHHRATPRPIVALLRLVPANIVWSVGDSLGSARNQDTLAHAETLVRMYLPRQTARHARKQFFSGPKGHMCLPQSALRWAGISVPTASERPSLRTLEALRRWICRCFTEVAYAAVSKSKSTARFTGRAIATAPCAASNTALPFAAEHAWPRLISNAYRVKS